MICRCVGMADEGDSKSLVLITRVGSTPTTGIKKGTSQLVWGVPFFICGVCAGRTARPCLAGRAISPAGCRSVRGRPPPPVTSPSLSGEFLFYLRRVSGSKSTARISNKECPRNACKRFRGTFYVHKTDCCAQPSSRLTMASIRSKHSSIWRTSVNWVRARSRLWLGRAVWK